MPGRSTFPGTKAKPARALPTPTGSNELSGRDDARNLFSNTSSHDSDKEISPTPPPKKTTKKKKLKKASATEQLQLDAQAHAPPKSKSKRRSREDDPESLSSGDEPPAKHRHVAPHEPDIVRACKVLDAGAKHETRLSNNTQHMYEAARLLPRIISPYTDYDSLLTAGIAVFDKMSVDDPKHDNREWGPYWEVYEHFSALEERFPGLNGHLKYLRQHPGLVKKMATFQRAGSFARPSTVEDFDDDPGEFCQNVQDMSENRIRIVGEDWPVCMYDMRKFNPDEDIRTGFLQSKLVLDARTLRTVRFSLCALNEWDDNDGDWHGRKFAENSEWMCGLKDWYTKTPNRLLRHESAGCDAMRKQRQAAEKAAQAHLKADKLLRLAQAQAARRALDVEEAHLLRVKKELVEPPVPMAEVDAELDGKQHRNARKGASGSDEDELEYENEDGDVEGKD
ncbi:hypothetical protein C8Q78DRAFT_994356 [Trametes maxima]|nr:hypothetical protein C8Q78DRAFT_995305 [Trametes maxima]KAI0667338.1 hypothetical protein C8Q78DRAFT_994356 [Trametes maxima]